MRNSRSLTRSDHRRHDRLLVARFAGGDSYPGEQEEARALVASCHECAALAADVKLLASSMSLMPRPARPRDFQLTADQAERLRGSRIERWLRGITGPGWATLRPVAGVALSIGLVLAVAGGGLPVTLPAAAPTEIPQIGLEDASAGQQQPSGEPSRALEPLSTTFGAPAAAEDEPVVGPTQAPEIMTDQFSNVYVEPTDTEQRLSQDEPLQPSLGVRELLIYAGLGLAAVSLGLLSLVWIARRKFADPLLR